MREYVDGTRRGLEQRREQIGREDRFESVEDRQDAFEAGPGVDVLLRQFVQRAVSASVVLREDEVPELHEAVLAPALGSAVGAELCALVKEDLRARSARSGRSHLPEVVRAESLDTTRRDADQVAPELFGLVVRRVHRDPESIGVESETLGDQAPRELDGALLEVVAEGEVAHHLEERQVALRRSDDVDVEGAKALLDRDGARVRRGLFLGEVRLEAK